MGVFDEAKRASAIEALDKVAAIILDMPKRLRMDQWHESNEWQSRSCAEEATCGTTHCLAGWLQVCASDETIRSMDAESAGWTVAPMAGKMFFESSTRVIEWLRNREYAA